MDSFQLNPMHFGMFSNIASCIKTHSDMQTLPRTKQPYSLNFKGRAGSFGDISDSNHYLQDVGMYGYATNSRKV